MPNTVVFTSTISPDLINWVGFYAEKRGITRRKVLEDALTNFQKQIQKKALRESFQKAAKDLEIRKMADWGLEDYNKQMDK